MSGKKKLVGPWRAIHSAVWVFGLAILAWKGWWWPGILVLVALSLILEAVIQMLVPGAVVEEPKPGGVQAVKEEAPVAPAPVPAPATDTSASQHRADLLPSECPKCGAPARGNEVHWTGPRSADCAYCGASLPLKQG